MAMVVVASVTLSLSLALGSSAGAQTTGAGTRSTAQLQGLGSRPAGCEGNPAGHRAHCYLTVEPAAPPSDTPSSSTSCAVNEAGGYTPCNLQNAYGLTNLTAKDGKGNTVAVVDPYDDPNAASDLAVYRSSEGLPACGKKCFRKVNQEGVAGSYPTPDQGSAQEISLDLDMVSAICPLCHILLVEANSNGLGDLGTAENEAVALGARVVSNSWGTGEFDGETGYDGYFDHPGVAITFSSGDGAYQAGVQYPSASPYVTSVGGTELTPNTSTRGWGETAWVTPAKPPTQGSGSGCSAYESKPPWQTDTGCAFRTTADVSAVAANVLSYDTYPSGGWYYSFGTSVSAPIIAGVYGLADNPSSITIPASAAYQAPAKDRHDIVKGKTGTCTPAYLCSAVKGYDGPTGLGTPAGIGAFKVPATAAPTITSVSFSGSPASPTITVAGANFGSYPPLGTPETCQSGDTGDDYGSSGLSFSDTTQGWGAGQSGDCIGLIVSSWSSTQVVFGFGNEYANYSPVASGDQVQVAVQGASFSGPLP